MNSERPSIAPGEGRFHRATSGDIVIERDAAGTAEKLSVPGLKVCATDDIKGVQWGKLLFNLNNALMPPLLRLPDALFEVVLGRTMKIDPEARSSMWEDLQRGRGTEIDHLQGVITDIAERRGLSAPMSRRIVALIRKAEADGKGSPGLTPEQIRG